MFNRLNYKTKNRFLLIAAVLFALMAYRLAIKKTIDQCKTYRNLKQQVDFAKDIPRKTAHIKMQIATMDKTLTTMQHSETNMQQALLGIVTNYCKENKVVLKEFPETIQTSGSDFLVQTNVFKIEGDFIKLLKLLYILEQKRKIGKIASVVFQTKTNFKTKNLELTATVFLQHVTKMNGDEIIKPG
ncbi:MAG: hypothetical protein ACHQNT_06235 [Bacteroidia bacterium]